MLKWYLYKDKHIYLIIIWNFKDDILILYQTETQKKNIEEREHFL